MWPAVSVALAGDTAAQVERSERRKRNVNGRVARGEVIPIDRWKRILEDRLGLAAL